MIDPRGPRRQTESAVPSPVGSIIYISPHHQDTGMTQETCLPAAEVYEDLSRVGRYRAALQGQLEADPLLLGDRLEQLGYVQVDADQWGASYRHRTCPNRRIEVDELPDRSGRLCMALTEENLTQEQAVSAGSGLEELYATLAEEFISFDSRGSHAYAGACGEQDYA